MKNPSGRQFFRLYDDTNKTGVDIQYISLPILVCLISCTCHLVTTLLHMLRAYVLQPCKLQWYLYKETGDTP